MPEEHNRVLTDHCSDLLFCPTETAVSNLRKEGIQNCVHRVGDTMLDAVRAYASLADQHSRVLETLSLQEKSFYLATIHRPSNTDTRENLDRVLRALGGLHRVVVLPLHPRTKARITQFALQVPRNVMPAAPVGYLDMLRLQKAAKVVLTDSGGVQKEACFLGTPCVTLRSETEWIETVQAGWNRVAGTEPCDVAGAVEEFENHELPPPLSGFGDGRATIRIAQLLGTAGPQARSSFPLPVESKGV
jgi:UDP-N-acetylglucosamine 2-epimerase